MLPIKSPTLFHRGGRRQIPDACNRSHPPRFHRGGGGRRGHGFCHNLSTLPPSEQVVHLATCGCQAEELPEEGLLAMVMAGSFIWACLSYQAPPQKRKNEERGFGFPFGSPNKGSLKRGCSKLVRLGSPLKQPKGGVFILGIVFVFFWEFFSLLASWLLGFLASWLLGFLASRLLGFLAFRLLGFLASWLLGFSASRLLGFWASWLLGFLASWLLGFLAFRLLGFSASGLLGFSAFCWFMRLLVAFWLFASFAFPVPLRQVAFFRHHGGGCRPPNPPRYVLDFLQRFN